MQREVRLIEEQLNKLCSQHDELMSLLEIVDYLPSIKYLQNLNTNLGNRISLADRRISETLPTLSRCNQQDQEQISLKNEQFSQLINQSQLLIDQITSQFNSLNVSTTKLEDKINSKELDQHQQSKKRSIRSLTQQGEDLYAREVAQQKRKFRGSSQSVKETIDLRLVSEILYSYEELQTKIATMRLSLGVPPLEQFCHFTCNRIKKEMDRIRTSVEQQTWRQSQEQHQAIKGRLVRLEFQIRGLKQFCGEQLMINFGQNQQKRKVHAIEQRVITQIQQIEGLIRALSRTICLD